MASFVVSGCSLWSSPNGSKSFADVIGTVVAARAGDELSNGACDRVIANSANRPRVTATTTPPASATRRYR